MSDKPIEIQIAPRRSIAVALGLNYYMKEYTCKKGHVPVFATINFGCKECLAQGRKKRYAEGRYRYANNPSMAENSKKYYEKNKEKLIEAARIRFNNSDEETKEKIRNYKRKYSRENSGKVKARRRKATPNWLTKRDFKDISNIVRERDRLTKETGIPHHLDHIIPIQGRGVCGLHVPWNLQPLPEKVNKDKTNKYSCSVLPSYDYISLRGKFDE